MMSVVLSAILDVATQIIPCAFANILVSKLARSLANLLSERAKDPQALI